MKIKSMHLENYRCFENFDIDFDDQLTVLVGTNGSGKTAVLDAVAVFLQRFVELSGSDDIVRGMRFDIVKPNMFEISDLTIGTPKGIICDYTIAEERYKNGERFSVAYRGDLSKSSDNIETVPVKKMDGEYAIERIPNKNGTSKYMMPHVTEGLTLSPLINQYRQCEENTRYPDGKHPKCDECRMTGRCATPIFIQYSSQRSLSAKIREMDTTGQNRVLFSPSLDFQISLKWFDAKDIAEARKRSNTPQKDYRNHELTTVREAISEALGTDENNENIYEFPHMGGDGEPEGLVINHRQTGITYQVSQLSDGYRTMLALVMDLARRMAVANEHVQWPEGQSVLHSPGIVLIDEVELHLHPSWQQTVLPKLMEIFPKVQFIVTTHSPQVLTTVAVKHIRVLKDGQSYTINDETEGAEPSRLLKDVLGVDSLRPKQNKWVQKLNEYRELVYKEQWDDPHTIGLRQELGKHFTDADPELMQLDLHVENSKWERGL